MMQALRAGGSIPTNDPEAEDGGISQSTYQQLYDVAREDLVVQFEAQSKAFLTDTDPAVRRAFLGSVSTLCVFFGSTKASDVILSHLNTYLNERDWQLKCAFLETIIGVATYVGAASFEEYILPLMVQALTDPEESVVERVLRSFSAIARLGLFQRSKTWELVDVVGRFLIHPNLWIREAAAQFVASATTYLSPADCHSIIVPLIKPYLRILPAEITELSLLDALKKPMPRLVLEMALTWALKVEKGFFWRSAQLQRTFSFGSNDDVVPTMSGRDLITTAFSRVLKNEEDENWLQRLRNAGMTSEDEFKLLALREYTWRVAHRKKQEEAETTQSPAPELNIIMTLKDLKIAPQTVFFDNDQDIFRYNSSQAKQNEKPRTITEALQDASTQSNGLQQRKSSGALEDVSIAGSPGSKAAAKQAAGALLSPMEGELDFIQPPKPRSRDAASIDSSSTRATEQTLPLRRKGSLMSIVGRTESGSKAVAETSTTPANAVGKIEGVFAREGGPRKASPLALAQDENRVVPAKRKQHNAHTYLGHDPSVLKLLDSLYLENYPQDMVEFGPIITPSKRRPIQRASGTLPGQTWKPEGTLVAMLGEHSAAVSRVVVAPDHTFFITASDDGTVKVWDGARLERNVTHRSRATHKHAPGVRVTSITFVENTHCFISTGSDGSVNVVKVDYVESQGTTRYSKLKVLREYQLPGSGNQFAVWSDHFKSENQSILVVVTNKSRIIALDLRTMNILFNLGNPVHHGMPTCFCADRRHHWLLLGTSHGVLDLWDLRFRLRLKSWVFAGGSPVHRICLSPGRSSRRNRVTIAGGTNTGEVTTWDLEKNSIREVYRTGLLQLGSSAKDHGTIKTPRLIDLEEDRPGSMLSRFGPQGATSNLESNSGSLSSDKGVKSVYVGAHNTEDGADPRHFFTISAGPDWKVRFWDPIRQDASCVVNGLDLDEGKPSYHLSHPSQDLTIITETLAPAPESAAGRPEMAPRGSSATPLPSVRSERIARVKSSPRKTARSSIISMQQQHLMKRHLDVIEDVALLELPYGMVVSCDRGGIVYVFS
jgi:phosphoinositide-3-kinase, regulatory subunit 4